MLVHSFLNSMLSNDVSWSSHKVVGYPTKNLTQHLKNDSHNDASDLDVMN